MTEEKKVQIGEAKASPTKAFFVRMLTRDIELQDAILDLLDNCLDGILRTGSNNNNPNEPYLGYHAKIQMCESHFVIEDNCGGIPYETACSYAFAMGRPTGMPEDVPSTIGMYGIGMKRAIFKLGTEALVESYKDTPFTVEFTRDWMESDDWSDLPIFEGKADSAGSKGTRITVFELNPETRAKLSDSQWVDDFRKIVAKHYSIILAKGFEIVVGTPEEVCGGKKPILAEGFRLLKTREVQSSDEAIMPYIFAGIVEGINVEIYAGLYRELLSSEDLDLEEETRGSSDEAGWTVACNDRVVIWKDKTRLTGWGEATVPNYHGQFIPITGIVLLHSKDSRKLPLTTTKRGIDASSTVYSVVKDMMREATKHLTNFTNKWKKFPDQRETLYKSTSYASLRELRAMKEELPMKKLRRIQDVSKFEPKYPTPRQEKTSSRVSFIAEKTAIYLLADHYFGTTEVKNEEVGKKAFQQAVERVKRSK